MTTLSLGLVLVGLIVGAMAVLVWAIRTFAGAQRAWAEGLYGAADLDGEREPGYADAVRRHASRRH